jgi:hypothetical protein
VDVQEEDLDKKRKHIITLQNEKEAQENGVLALQKSLLVAQEDEITAQRDKIVALEKIIASQKDKLTRKRKQIDDGLAERQTAEGALTARIRVLEAWVEETATILFEDRAKQADELARSCPLPSTSSSSEGHMTRTTKRARNDEP